MEPVRNDRELPRFELLRNLRAFSISAKMRFGITQEFDRAFFILPDGLMLAHPPEGRNSHRTIELVEVAGLPRMKEVDFKRAGFIRIGTRGSQHYLEILRRPNEVQRKKLTELFRIAGGEIVVDATESWGKYYPPGSSSATIIAEILRVFDGERIVAETTSGTIKSKWYGEDLLRVEEKVRARESRR